jgi:tRNA U34 5-methylaminomethyl-2-thiouridine-forming methyltransferase MnmC
MKRQILITKDGSETIAIAEMNVTYHSIHGAVQESRHIFIETGLIPLINADEYETINIFEMGFGTGLNTLLSYEAATQFKQNIYYTSIELYPLQANEYKVLQYNSNNIIQGLHECKWEEDIVVNEYFSLHKTNQSFLSFLTDKKFHLIYYDAFAPAAQPELWTAAIFAKLFSMLVINGVLVTYCSKSIVQKAMKAAGFIVEKKAGPPGKREIIKAFKTVD